MNHLLRFGSILLLVPLLFVAACGDDGGDDDTATSTTPTATGAASVDLSKDDLGRSVTVPANPQRIVAMSPSIVELMFAVGATPVGRPSSADYPEAAKQVPNFGTSRAPNLEALIAMKPDLIISDAILDDQAKISSLSSLGAPVFAVRVASFKDVPHSLRLVGALTGKKEAGETQAKALETKMADIKAKLPAQRPSVLVLVAAGQGQFIASRGNSYLGDILKEMGANNLVTSEPENFGYPGFTDYSPERIIEKNPDVIITSSIGGPPGTPKTIDLLKQTPAFANLKAVKEGRVYEVDPFVYIQSAGPRVAQILNELPGYLYPNVFASGR
ncbi:MAG: ABC transporter substrate-binding protein [Dehalococcoidia bacterium]